MVIENVAEMVDYPAHMTVGCHASAERMRRHQCIRWQQPPKRVLDVGAAQRAGVIFEAAVHLLKYGLITYTRPTGARIIRQGVELERSRMIVMPVDQISE